MKERVEIKFIQDPMKGCWVEYNGKNWTECNNEEIVGICAAGMTMQKGTMAHAFLLSDTKTVRKIQVLDKALDKLDRDYHKILEQISEFIANLKKS